MPTTGSSHRVVILGGGFGGLYAAEHLHGADANVTLVDRRNFHLFQPLLYQVATGHISPADIASPLRSILKKSPRVTTWQAEVTGLDADERIVELRDGSLPYDTLVVATGVHHHYFGNDHWESRAPGLKTIEDALKIRRRIFLAFETAERETDAAERQALLNFVIVGGGPTGVELAGAIGELAQGTLRNDFRRISSRDAKVYLVEGTDRILPTFPERLSRDAQRFLERLKVDVRTDTLVSSIDNETVTFLHNDKTETVQARTVLWAAGVRASSLARIIAETAGAELDNSGRVVVGPDLTLPGHPEIFVIGDLAHCAGADGKPLPGVAPVAMQQGRYVAKAIRQRLRGKAVREFRYRDKGSMAVIGRARAVAALPGFAFSGFFAWLTWLFIHILYLVEFDNRVKVLVQWAADYWSRKRGARLITGKSPHPLVGREEAPRR